ncbi:glycosyltransferase family 8 protein [Aulographum hederae CBS 113979]|uniref:Glycosyltransferase family 8 protein n=1 Tax=Aulographum hederae CBS 113979 TaxID=1176131 RepID=A0A6G1H9T6_9PEZI|nr:glycosyltransferase family 8 protein [Aulographum hederae CBS 113979]
MRPKFISVAATAAAIVLICSLIFFLPATSSLRSASWTPFPSNSWTTNSTTTEKPDASKTKPTEKPKPSATAIQKDPHEEATLEGGKVVPAAEKRAYATFLSTRLNGPQDDDPYFTAARVLAYQLLNQPSTRCNESIPFIVLVPPHVAKSKREVLKASGATIVPVSLLTPKTDWAHPGSERFQDQFTKLRLFELEEYDRIMYLDSDMLITKPLDGIWNEPAATKIYKSNKTLASSDESALPDSYMITGVGETFGVDHTDLQESPDMLNGGFFMLRPDKALFKHYVSILNIPNRFESGLMEQSLLNYAHRADGPMPFSHFPTKKWNVNWPTVLDYDEHVPTLHDKFWEGTEGGGDWRSRELVDLWWRVRGRMEGWWNVVHDPANRENQA